MAAAVTAWDIYLHLLGHGSEPTLAKYKPKVAAPNPAADEDQPVTVGLFLEEILRATSWRSVEDYAKAFRQIVSDTFFSDSAGSTTTAGAVGPSGWPAFMPSGLPR